MTPTTLRTQAKFRRRPLALAFLSICLLALPAFGDQPASEIEALLAAHVAALGDAEALAGLEGMARRGDLVLRSDATGPIAGSIELVIVPREKIYRRSELGALSTTAGWDGETAWEMGPAGLRTLAGSEAENLRSSVRIHPLYDLRVEGLEQEAIERLEDQEVAGQTYYVLAVRTGEGPPLDLWLDATTLQLARMVTSIQVPGLGARTVTIDHLDYEVFEGLALPTTTTVEIAGLFSTEIVFQETEINPEIDDALFSKPE